MSQKRSSFTDIQRKGLYRFKAVWEKTIETVTEQSKPGFKQQPKIKNQNGLQSQAQLVKIKNVACFCQKVLTRAVRSIQKLEYPQSVQEKFKTDICDV